MKKTLVVLLILAVAGGVFAQEITVGGQVFGSATLIQGQSAKDSDIEALGVFGRTRLQVTGQNDEETFGGWMRFQSGWDFGPIITTMTGSPPPTGMNTTLGPGEGYPVSAWGYAWWQPIQYVRFQVGTNPDGEFGADGIARWAFYGDICDVIIPEDYSYSYSFYGGFGDAGARLTITPIEGLEINVAAPFEARAGRATDVYGRIHAQVAYTLADIGKIAVTFAGDHGDSITGTGTAATSNGSTIFGYFGLSAIENLIVDFGIGFKLPVTEDIATGIDQKLTSPFAVGLAAAYDMGQFAVRARVQGLFAGKLTYTAGGVSTDTKLGTVIEFDVLPSFAINDMFKAFLSGGLVINVPDTGDSVVAWHVNPYITVSQGGGAFYAGFRLDSDGLDHAKLKAAGTEKVVNWSVPVGILYYF